IAKKQSQLTKNSSALIAGIFKNAPSFNGQGILENVETELKDISNILKKSPLRNQEFTQENVVNLLNNSDYSIVHFATHGQFSSDEEKTNIYAWDKTLNIKDLQTLIKTNQLQSKGIKLLVLSACETATGDQRAALGLAGIAISSGAESTLGSLWRVNDQSTAIFMYRFYHYLLEEKQTKAQALQTVQKEFLESDFFKSKEYNNPYYWAAFVLLGNGE
ncbi:MAG TPA: CHAT domain-containing protein, partial [Allocoleopsis sp.]